jgi:hypothetical protein
MDFKIIKQEVQKIEKNSKKRNELMNFWLGEGMSIDEFSTNLEKLLNNPDEFSKEELEKIFKVTGLDFTLLEEKDEFEEIYQKLDNIVFEIIQLKKKIKEAKEG